MSKGLSSAWEDALADAGIRTGYLARFDFLSETVCVSTLEATIAVSGSGDSALDGRTFDPLGHGAVASVGDNSFSYEGSDALKLALSIPESPSVAITNAGIFPDEYLSRPAWLWRCLMISPPGLGVAAVWGFKRIRAGAMDEVRVTHDGQNHLFSMTIEGFAATLSVASNASYLDQKRYDPNDRSQDFAVNIANGSPAPAKASAATAPWFGRFAGGVLPGRMF